MKAGVSDQPEQAICGECCGRGWIEIETGGPAGTMSNTCSDCEGEGVLYLVPKSQAAQLAATHAAIRALRGRFAEEAMEHLTAANEFDKAGDQSGNAHAELKAKRICREHYEALARLLGEKAHD